jgi:transcriptional regulator with XRE-family HTH domain
MTVKRAPPLLLAKWRHYRNKTQAQVAEALGITAVHVGRLERGERPYNQKLLEDLAEYLICEPAHLLMVDPTLPDAKWSLWETVQAVPEDRADDVRRVIEALIPPKAANGTT